MADEDLTNVLKQFQVWRYPRGDLHAWIQVLDRFDNLLGEIIKSYDLTKLQINDFTPKTKDMLLEILRVQRILMENCTNRKLFNSYDVCATSSLYLSLMQAHVAIIGSSPHERPQCSSCHYLCPSTTRAAVRYINST